MISQDYKIFVINIKKDKNRREYIKKHFAERKINFEFIEGIYGKDLTKQQLHELVDFKRAKKNLGREMSLNEIGCSLSHQKAYNFIVDKNLKGAFIFEDDVVLSHQISEIIETIKNNSYKFSEQMWLNLNKSYIKPAKLIFKINYKYSIYESVRVNNAIAYFIDYIGAVKLINKK